MTLSHSKLLSYLNKSQNKRFDVTDRDGLSVRVSEGGRITFQFRYRFKGKPVRMSIGRFPEMQLSGARNSIVELRKFLAEGKDPKIEINRKRLATKVPLNECVRLFLDRHVSKLRRKTQNLYHYSLNRHAINEFEVPVEDIVIHEWYEYFDYIEDTVSSVVAQDLLVRLKTCLRFCIRRNMISTSSILMISPKDVGKSSETGDRVVSPEEVKQIWRALDASKAFELVQWQLNMFSELTSYVFPSGNYTQQISPQTINKLCRLIIKRHSMIRWTCHDFRRSLSTILSANGVELHVTEKVLGHSLGGILAVYNKHDWLTEQLEAYELWESLIV